ncbi:Hypothetical predicted protein [Pelobates cultripes]|uniref:Uncharacterized protein n=1 Tax=Pelobates cultripes TaxID=61616 RepID=A0AAD1W111_PELCU|nr:Hypothetical predicted protein [Pelobates cultripes]
MFTAHSDSAFAATRDLPLSRYIGALLQHVNSGLFLQSKEDGVRPGVGSGLERLVGGIMVQTPQAPLLRYDQVTLISSTDPTTAMVVAPCSPDLCKGRWDVESRLTELFDSFFAKLTARMRTTALDPKSDLVFHSPVHPDEPGEVKFTPDQTYPVHQRPERHILAVTENNPPGYGGHPDAALTAYWMDGMDQLLPYGSCLQVMLFLILTHELSCLMRQILMRDSTWPLQGIG